MCQGIIPVGLNSGGQAPPFADQKKILASASYVSLLIILMGPKTRGMCGNWDPMRDLTDGERHWTNHMESGVW